MTPLVGRLADQAVAAQCCLLAGRIMRQDSFALPFVLVGDITILLPVAALTGASVPPVVPAVRPRGATSPGGSRERPVCHGSVTPADAVYGRQPFPIRKRR